MAFSQALEEVIEAALADGVLTDKERAVLHKRAAQEGVDPDELDVVIEGRLAKMKRETDWLKPAPPASEKRGNIVKCPSCGAPVRAGATRCEECGYEFTNVKATHSTTVFFESIQKEMNSKDDRDIRNEKINMMIHNFPVPTAKEDILEFLYMGIPSSKKKGNFITLYPALFGGIIGIFLILLLGLAFVSEKDIETSGFFSSYIGWVGMICFTAWWLPLAIGGVVWFVLRNKSNDLKDINARANAWKSKSEQIISKARMSMQGDPDLQKIEMMAKEIGL